MTTGIIIINNPETYSVSIHTDHTAYDGITIIDNLPRLFATHKYGFLFGESSIVKKKMTSAEIDSSFWRHYNNSFADPSSVAALIIASRIDMYRPLIGKVNLCEYSFATSITIDYNSVSQATTWTLRDLHAKNQKHIIKSFDPIDLAIIQLVNNAKKANKYKHTK